MRFIASFDVSGMCQCSPTAHEIRATVPHAPGRALDLLSNAARLSALYACRRGGVPTRTTHTTVTKLIDSNKLPHLLFYGPPGTGKTSTILACARKLYGDEFKMMVLEVSAEAIGLWSNAFLVRRMLVPSALTCLLSLSLLAAGTFTCVV